ncbi:hypothetical protein PINS_up009103 [Pythium insidiosum]|nr:hypothetical protein PINS_up009103 [Pythium insidiosum]
MWVPIRRAVAALLSLATIAALADAALLNRDEFLYDGKTTYCYWVNQGMSVVSLDYSYVKIEGKNLECPMTLTVAQSSAGPIRPRQDVEYLFTAKLNLNDNRFGMKALEATIPDPTTGRPVHIGHANIHTCSITTACDVFRNGANRKISDQETSNFTDDSATFRQRIAFDREGEYNVFAHLVLPPKNPFNESYHFVVFTTTKVIATDASTSKGATDSTGMPTMTIVGLVVGSIVLIIGVVAAVLFRRRRQPGLPYGNDHFRHSAYAPSLTVKNSRLDWNGDPDYQFGHDRYQSSMVSEFRQPPGLTASALMFQENRASRRSKQKTVSSSGSSYIESPPRLESRRGYGLGRGTSSKRSTIGLPDQHGVQTYETYYTHDNGYDLPDDMGIRPYTSEGSVGTSMDYAASAYAPSEGLPPYAQSQYGGAVPSFHLKHAGIDRESDLSSLNDYEYGLDRRRAGTDDTTMKPLSELCRDSDYSVGTVDFPPRPPRSPTSQLHQYRETEDSMGDSQYSHHQRKRYTESEASSDMSASQQTVDFSDSSRTFKMHDRSAAARPSSELGNSRVKRAVSADSESYEF